MTMPHSDLPYPAEPHDFTDRIAGSHSDNGVETSCGQLIVVDDPCERRLNCPTCNTGVGLVHQEWMHAVRPVVHSGLHRVDDPDCSTPLWFVTLAATPEEDSAFNLTDTLAASLHCRLCDRAYALPPDVHAALPWSLA